MKRCLFRRRCFTLFALLGAFSLALSSPSHALLKETRPLLGTVVEITINDLDESKAQAGMDQAFLELARIEDLMSYYRENSEISRINAAAVGQNISVSAEVFRLLQHAQVISLLTDGAFDITFAPLWELWGRCAKEKRLPSSEELSRAKALVDFREICLNEKTHEVRLMSAGMRLNLGGIAKGYALGRAGEVLREAGLENYLITLGGDILAKGEGREGKGWRVAILHPRKAGEFVGILRIKEGCVLTSGDYERYFEIQGKRYHHILDARSGYPASSCSAVTVLAPRLGPDYLPSLAVFLLGPEKGMELLADLPEVAGLIITPQGRVLATVNLSPFLEAPLPDQIDMKQAD